jgi:hypothetical protein
MSGSKRNADKMMTNSGYKLVFTTMINLFHKPFVDDFHSKTNLVLHRETFILLSHIFHVFHPAVF